MLNFCFGNYVGVFLVKEVTPNIWNEICDLTHRHGMKWDLTAGKVRILTPNVELGI